jgi:hypothetical protein
MLDIAVEEVRAAEWMQLLATFIEAHPDVWNEDIGEA